MEHSRKEIQSEEQIDRVLEDALEFGLRYIGEGKLADYIPALTKANPNHLGITVLTRDGVYHSVGDTEHSFTIQSVGKVLLLIYALVELGSETVFDRVGVEPSGDSFNSIVKLETKQNYPLNPFINAGAIATMGLVLEKGLTFDDFMGFLERLAGRSLEIDETVYRSEQETGDLNRSLAYFMKSHEVIKGDMEAVLDAYFRLCAILVTTKDLAHFGMVLANDGFDLITGEPIISSYEATLVKTIMVTCGMYDSSGEFAVKVGMPAKSGVSGGILSLSQGKVGVGVYSPALDEKGNSVCGVKALEFLSWSLNLHFFSGNQ